MDNEWAGDERRKSHVNNIKDKIWKRIEETTDDNMKSILMLMFGSLEYTDAAMQRIEAKLDALRHDEATLKKLVLNGHDGKHHSHHDWLENRISKDKFYSDFIDRTTPIIDWVEQHKREYEDIKPIIVWARTSKESQETVTKDKKTLFMKFLEGIVGHVGTAIATILIAWIMWGPK